jgi:photosystem II stability/assembly factor-like uncharacterized protein
LKLVLSILVKGAKMKIFKSAILSLVFLTILAQPINSQWIKKSFSYSDALVKVGFSSENVGWALGNNHIYRTTDGGDSWVMQDTVYSFGLSLYALNDTTAVFADYGRGIRKTSDGGTTWTTAFGTNYTLYNIKFLNSTTGYAVGDANSLGDTSVVAKTTDAGDTWTVISKPYTGVTNNGYYDFEGLSLVDATHFWAVTYGSSAYYSSDGGYNWSFNDSIRVSDTGQPLRDIQFINADSGWAVGGIAGDAVIAQTTDGGANWSSYILSYSFSDGSIREIHMINSQTGWFVSANNGPSWLAKTTNGGVNWQDQTPEAQSGTFSGFYSMSIVNDSVAYVVGNASNTLSYVYKTTTGGVTAIDNTNSEKITNFYLAQNYPNPFNPATLIKYQILKASDVTIKVYDILGREVRTLVNEYKSPGSYNVTFNAANLSSGIYIYQMKAGNYVSSKKLVLMK